EFSLGEIRRSQKAFPSYWKSSESNMDSGEEGHEFDDAFKAEFGFTAMEFSILVGQVYALGQDQPVPYKRMPRQQLIRELVSNTDISESTVVSFMDGLSLTEREHFLNPDIGSSKSDIYPWRFNRNLAHVRRPLVSSLSSGDDIIYWGNRHLLASLWYIIELVVSGRLKAQSREMSILIKQTQQQESEAFNTHIYDILSEYPNMVVKRKIKKFTNVKFGDSLGDLGDIDVLAANTRKERILLVEVKDFETARTPAEFANEISKLFHEKKGRGSSISRVRRRHTWVEENIEFVAQELGLEYIQSWEVESVVVTSHELITPYLINSPVNVIPLRRFSEEFLPEWASD
ncbi:MAG: hypothetical protein R6U37_00005, partial [Dehalococcoidia bacterium]